MSVYQPAEIIDSQIIFHPHEVLRSIEMDPADRETAAIESAVVAMDAVGVHKALWHGEFTLCEVAVRHYPERFRGVPYFPEPDVPDIEGTLERVMATPGFAAFRLTPAWPATGENIERLHAGAYDRWLIKAEKLGLPLSLFVAGHLCEAARIAERYPELPILIDHIGMIPPPYVPLVPTRLDPIPELLALSKYDNVAVKFSGVAALSYERFPFADLWPACHQILDAFGADRLMWGSDFRRILPLHPYRDLVDFLRLTDEVSDEVKTKLFSTTLRTWLGWEPSGHGLAGKL